MQLDSPRYRPWMVSLLRVAGIYFIIWGISVVISPTWWFSVAHLKYPNYIPLWQYVGMVELVLGIGYFLAAANPLRHWVVILIGFLTKLFLTIGFFYDLNQGLLPPIIFNMAFTNGIIWLIPYGIILYSSFKMDYELDENTITVGIHEDNGDFLKEFETQTHDNLYQLSFEKPVLLIFLRHFGCTFCREALSQISKKQTPIKSTGTEIVLVHQKCFAEASGDLYRFNLHHLKQISDPELLLFKYFNLKRGKPQQLFGLKMWARFFRLGIIQKLGLGFPANENPYQMPGVFLINNGKIIKSFIHDSVADTPDYLELAHCQSHDSPIKLVQ